MRPFDQIGPDPTAATPSTPSPARGRGPRLAAPLLAIAFAGSTLFAGAIGAVGGAQLVRSQLETAAPVSTPVAPAPTGSSTNGQTVASAVYEKVSSSVVQLIVGG